MNVLKKELMNVLKNFDHKSNSSTLFQVLLHAGYCLYNGKNSNKCHIKRIDTFTDTLDLHHISSFDWTAI